MRGNYITTSGVCSKCAFNQYLEDGKRSSRHPAFDLSDDSFRAILKLTDTKLNQMLMLGQSLQTRDGEI